jgi:hypothetical protein
MITLLFHMLYSIRKQREHHREVRAFRRIGAAYNNIDSPPNTNKFKITLHACGCAPRNEKTACDIAQGSRDTIESCEKFVE